MNIIRPLFFFLFYQPSQKFFWGPNLYIVHIKILQSQKNKKDQDTSRKIDETKSTPETKLHCFC